MKNIKVTIKDINNTIGTVKWLESQNIEIVIKINEKTESPACYLVVGNYRPEIIAGVGIEYKQNTGHIEKTYNNDINDIPLFDDNRNDGKCKWFGSYIPWTETAKDMLEKIADYGREIFEEEIEKLFSSEKHFEFHVK